MLGRAARYAPRMSDVTIRDASEGDTEAVAAMAHRAFRIGDGTGWLPMLRDSPNVREGHTVMSHVRGVHAGNATALALEMSIRGVDLPIAGIAAVATRPEHRRRGVAQAMLRALLLRAREARTPWAMLHGISLGFYRKLGFGLAEQDVLILARGAFPRSAMHREVRPWERADDEPAMRALYERLRAGTTGQLVRGDYWWSARVFRAGTDAVVVTEGDRLTGYALFDVPSDPEYPQQRVHLTELRAETPHAHRALFAWADTLRDQFNEVRLLTSPSMALALVREHGVREVAPEWSCSADPFGVACAGAMARVVDLSAALAVHPWEGSSARASLTVIDPLDDAPQDLDLIAEGASIRVEPSRAGGVRLQTPIDALSTVVLGATRAATLHALGFIDGDAATARTLDRMFPPTEVHLGQRNHF